VAAKQNYFQNRPILRRHGYLFQRSIIHCGQTLAQLETELLRLDRRDYEANSGKSKENQSTTYTTCTEPPEDVKELLGKITEAALLYGKPLPLVVVQGANAKLANITLADKDMRSLPGVSDREHLAMWDQLKEEKFLDEDTMRGFMAYPDDCVTTRVDRRYAPFEELIHRWPRTPFLVRHIPIIDNRHHHRKKNKKLKKSPRG